MKIQHSLLAIATSLSKLIFAVALILLAQFASAGSVSAQTPTTLQGRVLYQFPNNSTAAALNNHL